MIFTRLINRKSLAGLVATRSNRRTGPHGSVWWKMAGNPKLGTYPENLYGSGFFCRTSLTPSPIVQLLGNVHRWSHIPDLLFIRTNFLGPGIISLACFPQKMDPFVDPNLWHQQIGVSKNCEQSFFFQTINKFAAHLGEVLVQFRSQIWYQQWVHFFSPGWRLGSASQEISGGLEKFPSLTWRIHSCRNHMLHLASFFKVSRSNAKHVSPTLV